MEFLKGQQSEQGSPEWLAVRKEHMTASQAASYMSDDLYKGRNQLLSELSGFSEAEEITPIKQAIFDKGHATEESARTLLELDEFEDFTPKVGVVEIDGMKLLASFDGITDDCTRIFEHKSYNKSLAQNVKNSVMPASHYWQLEFQLLVSSASHVIFITSDGTAEKKEQMNYYSQPERRARLIAGLKQFNIDLDIFEPEAKQEIIIAGDVEDFPVPAYSMNGTEITCNIASMLPALKERAALETNRTLETDQDFADKEKFNKSTKEARAKLKEMVSNMTSEFSDLDRIKSDAAEFDSILQKMQASGEKQVKDQKVAKKLSIIVDAQSALTEYISSCNNTLAPMTIAGYLLRIMTT